jgi:hypothetical protein
MEPQAQQVLQAQVEQLGLMEPQALRVPLELPALLESMGPLALLAQQVLLVPQVPQVLKEPPASQVPQA